LHEDTSHFNLPCSVSTTTGISKTTNTDLTKVPTYYGAICNNINTDSKETILERLIEQYSSLPHAVRSAAWLLRIKACLRKRIQGKERPLLDLGPVTSQEYDEALISLIRIATGKKPFQN